VLCRFVKPAVLNSFLSRQDLCLVTSYLFYFVDIHPGPLLVVCEAAASSPVSKASSVSQPPPERDMASPSAAGATNQSVFVRDAFSKRVV
jgi:hypothetical protein